MKNVIGALNVANGVSSESQEADGMEVQPREYEISTLAVSNYIRTWLVTFSSCLHGGLSVYKV